MPDASISRNPGVLSSHTVRTLKTETREKPEAEGGFWDKFKSLSLGQKIGRSFATIGSGVAVGGAGLGIGMAAGLGLGIATGGIAAVAFGLGALGLPLGVARQHDVAPARQRAEARRQRLPGASAHDHRAARGDAPEVGQVLRQAPGHVAAVADHAVARDRGDELDERAGHVLCPGDRSGHRGQGATGGRVIVARGCDRNGAFTPPPAP